MRHWAFYKADGTYTGKHIATSKPGDLTAWVESNTPVGCYAAEWDGRTPLTRAPRNMASRTVGRLERSQHRAVREALLLLLPDGPEKTRLQQLDDQIAARREELKP